MYLRAFVSLLFAVSLGVAGLAPASGAATADSFEDYAERLDLSGQHADVFRLYWAFFDRAPDRDGADYWVQEYDRCVSLRDIAWLFGNSNEFQQRYGDLTNSGYVDLVYANVLDRVPDDEGRAYWLGLIDRGEIDRVGIMLNFSLSDEFRRKRPLPSDGRAYGGCKDPAEVPLFENCSAARDAGAAPVHRSDPGYGPHLDRDGDGLGCE